MSHEDQNISPPGKGFCQICVETLCPHNLSHTDIGTHTHKTMRMGNVILHERVCLV